MDYNQLLIIVGSLNAIVFAAVLFLTKINVKANALLAVLILSLALNLVLSWALALHIFDTYPILHLLPFGIGFGLGPLIYLYAQTLCSDEKPNYYHLLFFIADYPHSIYHLIFGRETNGDVHEFLDKFSFFALIVIVFYLWKAWKSIQSYQNDLKNNVSNITNQTLSWLKQLVILFLISIPVFLILWILLITIGLEFNDRFVGYLYYNIAVFWLGIGGLRQHQLLATQKKQITIKVAERETVNELHINKLIQLMEQEQLYLYPDLDMRLLTRKLDISARQISEVLNTGLGKNFYRFINEYRVEAFKENVKSNTTLTLYGVAMESGFNSKATFQRVFKEITGMRPTDFVKTLD